MKKIILLNLIFSSFILQSQTTCDNGMAASFPCNGYDLLSHIPLSTFNAAEGSDSWGWTDPTNNKEYALMALNTGVAFIDISDPINPIYLGQLPSAAGQSTWRDVKVYKNHAYVVSDFVNIGNHGMQVFDLTRLRNVTNPPETFTVDARYTGFGNAHNIVINEQSGYAYAVGTSTFEGGPHFIDIRDPKNPVAAGGFISSGNVAYSHDAQVITYNGPDTEHVGKEILIGSNIIEIVIADITDKANPQVLSTISYSDVGYTHQGWFTEDQRYFLLGDEADEATVGFNTRTIIFDFEDLDNPVFHMNYSGPTTATDHNGYVKGDKFYLSSYRAGLRVMDISDIANKNITEIGYFDSFPSSDSATQNGAWSVYPYFESGNIVISDIESGFFLVRPTNTLSVDDFETKSNFAMYPNPTSSAITIDGINTFDLKKIEIFNVVGKKMKEITKFDNSNSITINLEYDPGIYLLRINDVTKKLIIN